MRHIPASLLAAFLLVLAAFGQQRTQPQLDPRNIPPPLAQQAAGTLPAKISVAVNLVLIDVRVTDREGKTISGLKPEQFVVFEDEKPQTISSFQFFDVGAIETAGTGDGKPVVVPLAGAVAPQQVQDTVRNHRLIVLFYDLTSLQPDDLQRATSAGRRYLKEQMSPADLVAVVSLGNQFHILCNFTNNRDSLLRAIGSLIPGKDSQLADLAAAAPAPGEEAVVEDTGEAFTGDETEFNIFNTDRKLSAIESLAKLLRDIPGKKSVIHFTSGITQTGEENRSLLDAAVDAANRSNVSLYTVDARGLFATTPLGDARMGAATGTAMFSGAAVFRQTEMRHASRDTLATLAIDTGGRAFFDLGDFSAVFKKVQEEGTGYYLLGYYSTDPRRDGRWRRVRVKANAPGAHIHYREGYYAAKDYKLETSQDRVGQLEEALRAEAPRVDIPIALEAAHFRINDREYFVPISAKIASSALEWAEKRGKREVNLDFAAEVRDEQSHRIVAALQDTMNVSLESERFQQLQRHALLYQGGAILVPGTYRLKFVAREDETGRMGTFEEDFILPPLDPAKLALSSMLLSSQIDVARTSTEVKKSALGPDAKLKTTPLDLPDGRIVPSVTRLFTTQQKMHVFFQAYSPLKEGASELRAGLVIFRNGEWFSETPLSHPAEVDSKTRQATFLFDVPLDSLSAGRYTVQAVAVEAGGEQAAFARNYFAVRLAPQVAPTSSREETKKNQ